MNCPKCGAQIADNTTFCGYCGHTIEPAPAYQQPAYTQPTYPQPDQPEKKENVVMGAVGAAVGALLGALAIFLFLKMNMVAGISGVILAFCSLKGYELLGGKLSTLGIIICLALMLITPYIANDVYWATEIMDEFSVEFSYAYKNISNIVYEDVYSETLVQIYIFTIIGGAACVWNTIKNKK